MALVLYVVLFSSSTPYAPYSKCVCVNKIFYPSVSVKVSKERREGRRPLGGHEAKP